MPRFSVMRIESAKQQMLHGKPYRVIPQTSYYIRDWTAQDEEDLMRLLEDWDPADDLPGLCDLLDDYQFSAGSLNNHLGKPPGTRCGGRPMSPEEWRPGTGSPNRGDRLL